MRSPPTIPTNTAVRGAVRAYLRVSSDRQAKEGTSLDGQERAHRAYCARRGLPEPILYVEVESASEGKIEAREEQLRLQREAAPGDLVLVTMLDRWSRDVPHAVLTVRALLSRGVGWIAIDEGIDASTNEGMLMLQYRAIAAEQELRRITERMVGGRRRIAAAGGYAFAATPIGYQRTADRRLVIEPREAAIVREVFALCIAGRSSAEIATMVRHPRLRAWSQENVKHLLDNRWVLGEARISGASEWRAGAHEAIITADLWDAAHASLASRRPGGRRPGEEGPSSRALLTGLAWCVRCGRRVSVKGNGRGGRVWYMCRTSIDGAMCGEPWPTVREIDELAAALVLARVAELREHLAAPLTAAPRRAGVGHEGTTAALARLEARKRRAVALALDADETTADALRDALAGIESEMRTLRARQAAEDAARAREDAAADPQRRAALLRSVDVLHAAWEAAPVAERREWIRLLAHRVEVGRGVVRPAWRSLEELTAEEL